MSMEWVRSTYGVPAKRGGRVRLLDGFGAAAGKEGTITSATNRINVRLDDDGYASPFHPTWELEYLDPSYEKETP